MTENDPKDTTTEAAHASQNGSPEGSPARAEDASPSTPAEAHDASRDAGASDGEGASDRGDADGEADGEGEGDADAAEGGEGGERAEGGRKRRRGRRRKKKSDGGGERPEGAADDARARPSATAPFARWFEGTERKHAFQAGEIVAGMVTRVEAGAATVDLFGKATAFVDVLEPREIEPIPEPVTPVAPVADSGSPEASVPDVAGEAPVAEGATESASEDGSSAADARDAAVSEPTVVEGGAEAGTSAGDVAAVEAEAAEEAVLAEAEDAAEAEAESDDEGADREAAPSVANASVEPPEVGEIFRGRIASVSESGHVVLINRYIDKPKAKERVRAHAAERRRVQGVVYGFNRGGFDVIVEGIRVFCPASAMALEPISDPTAYVGQKLEFTLPPSKGGRSIVVSRRTLLERELRKQRRDAMNALEPGTRRMGRITGHREYGVLVDIGDGLEGLVHLSELGWSRGTRPTDVGPVGTEVEVMVGRVVPISRKERFGKIALSIRACLPDPWTANADVVREGHAQLAKVTRTAEFGAFLELAPGLDGMLHISELGGKDLRHANQVLKEGDELAVLVERVDPQNRRIALSKLSAADAEALRNGTYSSGSTRGPKPGALVNAVIEKVEHHGFLVQIEGISGRKGRGYLSNRDLGEYDGEKRKSLVVGKKLEVKVVGADRDGSLKVSVKAKQVDEERNAVRDYKRESAKQGLGTFGDLLKAKLGQKV